MAKPQQQNHPKGPCRNEDCPRRFCQGYQLGYDEGWMDGYAAGKAAAGGDGG